MKRQNERFKLKNGKEKMGGEKINEKELTKGLRIRNKEPRIKKTGKGNEE